MQRRTALALAGALVVIGGFAGTGVTLHVKAAEAERVAAAEQQAAEVQAKKLAAERHTAVSGASAARTSYEAQVAIDAAVPVIAAAEGKADASALAASVASLSEHETLAPAAVYSLVSDVESTIPIVQTAVAEAEAQAAAEAARLAAEAERLAAERRTPAGAQAFARELMASKYGWGGDQASCLINLWQKESNWRWDARNASSGATGIPQSLPGSKMASHGADWQTNPETQISWGLDYIQRAYGTPCGAWGKSQAVGWY